MKQEAIIFIVFIISYYMTAGLILKKIYKTNRKRIDEIELIGIWLFSPIFGLYFAIWLLCWILSCGFTKSPWEK